MRFRSPLAVLMVIALMPAFVFAGTTGKISGTVTDASTGKPLPYVNVIVQGTTLGAATDENGEFFVIGIPAGSWTIRASMIGYADYVETDVPVSADLTTKLDFELTPEALQVGEIVVVAERRLIQPDVTATTRITSKEDIDALPVNTFQEVLANNTSTSGNVMNNMHVRGGRAGEAIVLVDGMAVQEPQLRFTNLNVGTEALAEMQLISGGFNAEYGQAQSGVIVVTTRSGSPDFYSGKFRYTADNVGDSGFTDSYQNRDYLEMSFGGPEPITSKVLPQLGVKLPGNLTFFIQGDALFHDISTFHPDAYDSTITRLTTSQQDWWNDFNAVAPPLDYAITKELGTSESLLEDNILDDLFGFGKRENATVNGNIKFAYAPTPTYNVTFSHRMTDDKRSFWHFTQGAVISDVIAQAQALGIDDGIDNDGDGLIDEEIFNGIDDDGDGYIDELDAVLVDPADYEGGALAGFDLGWGVDRDGDGVADEEAWNGVDDDGDGLIDEDLQAYQDNGWDYMYKRRRVDNQSILTWKHILGSGSAFYEVKLSRHSSEHNWLPKRGKDGESPANIDEIREWLDEYEDYRVDYDAYIQAINEGDTTAVEPDPIDPYLGFGNVQEQYVDENGNFRYDNGEPFTDTNGNGLWDYFNPSGTNRCYYFEGETHPFRGIPYYGVTGYTTGNDASFFRSGVDFRKSTTYALKADLTNQINKHHQIKTGIEAKYYDLENWSRQLLNGDNGRGLFQNNWHVYPHAGAAYLQDKMEYQSAIVNMGLRVDYFDAGDQVEPVAAFDENNIAINPSVPRAGDEPPKATVTVLPRFGISFPVTDKDVFHFFYGHFSQEPALIRVFDKVNAISESTNDRIGNPFLEPERTISYEFGIKHQFGLNALGTVTAFFKDIDNLVQVDRVFETERNLVYHSYVNSDYGTVRGLEFTLAQRDFMNFSGEASYTYQIATTTNSGATDVYYGYEQLSILPGREYPADWDIRHNFSFNLSYSLGEEEGPEFNGFYPFEYLSLSLLGEVNSGQPYTPTSGNDTPLYDIQNSKRYPWTHNWDLRLNKQFSLAGLRWGLQADILNIFNSLNVVGGDDANTGLLDAYRERYGYTNQSGASSLRNYGGFENAVPEPNAWYTGRRIRVGVTVEF